MICKRTQNTIDTLLSLKENSTSSRSTTINRIGSFEDSTAAPIQCGKSINELMDNYKTQNKIASSQSTTTQTTTTIKIGEVAEFQSLLKAYIH